MKKIHVILFCSIAFFCSCKKDIQIPAYLYINTPIFNAKTGEGTTSQAIEHVGVYVDDQLFGIYEIPFTVPIEKTGTHQLVIRPFIKRNAYEGYIVNSLFTIYEVEMNFESDITKTITPIFEYRPEVNFKYLEDFNDNFSSFEIKERFNAEDTFFITNDKANSFDSTPYMQINLKSGDSKILIATSDEFTLPTDGRETYLELNYKTNLPFTIGIVSRDAAEVVYLPLVAPYATDGQWKKGYIALRDELAALGNKNIIGFKLFFGALNTDTNFQPEILIDNLKIVYRD